MGAFLFSFQNAFFQLIHGIKKINFDLKRRKTIIHFTKNNKENNIKRKDKNKQGNKVVKNNRKINNKNLIIKTIYD